VKSTRQRPLSVCVVCSDPIRPGEPTGGDAIAAELFHAVCGRTLGDARTRYRARTLLVARFQKEGTPEHPLLPDFDPLDASVEFRLTSDMLVWQLEGVLVYRCVADGHDRRWVLPRSDAVLGLCRQAAFAETDLAGERHRQRQFYRDADRERRRRQAEAVVTGSERIGDNATSAVELASSSSSSPDVMASAVLSELTVRLDSDTNMKAYEVRTVRVTPQGCTENVRVFEQPDEARAAFTRCS